MSLNSLKIPSKTFLLGEYGVLFGGPILVLTHKPFFSIVNSKDTKAFHPKSPASLLMEEFSLTKDFDFCDPHESGGGFGGSTAEVVASLKNRVSISLEELHKKYLNLFSSSKVPPSGADLLAQWSEASSYPSAFKLHVLDGECVESFEWPFKDTAVLVYKRPAKLKTHSHLEELSADKAKFYKLIKAAKNGIDAFKNSNNAFYDFVEEFARQQKDLGLIDECSCNEVEMIKTLSGVVSARACGAMGVDVVTVFCSLKEDLDKLKAKIVDFDFNYKLVSTLSQGDFKSV